MLGLFLTTTCVIFVFASCVAKLKKGRTTVEWTWWRHWKAKKIVRCSLANSRDRGRGPQMFLHRGPEIAKTTTAADHLRWHEVLDGVNRNLWQLFCTSLYGFDVWRFDESRGRLVHMIRNFSFKIITMHCSIQMSSRFRLVSTYLTRISYYHMWHQAHLSCGIALFPCSWSQQQQFNRVVRFFLRKRLSCIHV